MKTFVLFSALIVVDTTKWGFGEQFIKTLTQLPTKLRPEKVGNWERKTVPFESVEACGNLWAPSATYKFEGQTFDSHLDFHWRRTSRLRTHGWIVHTGRRLDGSQILGSIRTYHTPARDIDWYDVFLSYCRSCKPHLATVHLHAPGEERSDFPSESRDFKFGPFQWQLEQRKLPQLPWCSYWDEKLAHRVGMDVATTTIEANLSGSIVRISPSIFDVVDDPQRFESRRTRARTAFPRPYFLMPERP